MAKKKGKGFGKPDSTVTRVVDTKNVKKRHVTFKGNSSSAELPGKLVPRFEKPNIPSNTIPGRKKKKKKK